jgi:GNAT superfamily N-acetyltransferase
MMERNVSERSAVAAPTFRPADPSEAATLGDMVMAGVSHWGHDVNFPAAVEGLRANGLPTPDYVAESPVFVLEDDSGLVGFYGLRLTDDFVDLVYMFLHVGRIGAGHGRRLWNHAVVEAAKHGSRLRILSDPGAVGFYAAMGATPQKEVEVSRGFRLTLFWYNLDAAGDVLGEVTK